MLSILITNDCFQFVWSIWDVSSFSNWYAVVRIEGGPENGGLYRIRKIPLNCLERNRFTEDLWMDFIEERVILFPERKSYFFLFLINRNAPIIILGNYGKLNLKRLTVSFEIISCFNSERICRTHIIDPSINPSRFGQFNEALISKLRRALVWTRPQKFEGLSSIIRVVTFSKINNYGLLTAYLKIRILDEDQQLGWHSNNLAPFNSIIVSWRVNCLK